jgi:hypothetical protein
MGGCQKFEGFVRNLGGFAPPPPSPLGKSEFLPLPAEKVAPSWLPYHSYVSTVLIFAESKLGWFYSIKFSVITVYILHG